MIKGMVRPLRSEKYLLQLTAVVLSVLLCVACFSAPKTGVAAPAAAQHTSGTAFSLMHRHGGKRFSGGRPLIL